jgi:lipoprotein-anchoring transpeptidase ErfK/SrfK
MHVTHRLVVVDRERLTLSVYSVGRLLWSAPIGIGLAASPTPAGHFWIREVLRINDPSSGYYPVAFGTAAYSHLTDWPGGGVVGIHGPFFDPQAIPGRVSHGCIRLRVADDAKLAEYVAPGTPLLIR